MKGQDLEPLREIREALTRLYRQYNGGEKGRSLSRALDILDRAALEIWEMEREEAKQ